MKHRRMQYQVVQEEPAAPIYLQEHRLLLTNNPRARESGGVFGLHKSSANAVDSGGA